MQRLLYITIIAVGMLGMYGCESSDLGVSESFDGGSTTGVGSSLAKFTISGNTLYYADFEALIIYDISNGDSPQLVKRVETGIGIETIFPYEHYLFLGGQRGVEIYDITNPQSPQYTSTFTHSQSCDPVIVKNDIAYVTLRQATSCNATIPFSVLTVLDVSNVRNPIEVSTQPMEDPYGLTFYKGDLYVSEGDLGLKKFDLTDPKTPVLDTFYQDISTYDLLGLEDVLLVTGSNGLYSFDVVDNELIELAKIQK